MSGFSLYKSIIVKTAAISFAAVALLTYLTISVTSRGDLRDYAERRYQETELVLRAAIDPRFQTKADELARVCERLVVIEAIKGGAMIDDSGHLQQSFGERPEIGFQDIMRTGRQIFSPYESNRVEFYFPPNHTHTPFHIVVRVSSADMASLEAIGKERASMLAVVAGLLAALVAGLTVSVFVAWPLRSVNMALDEILKDPASADDGVKLRAGGSEIGVLARSVDFLRSRLADVWRTKVLVADSILESSPFATIQITPDGTPVFGNPACNSLFGRDVVRSFGTAPLVVWDVDAEQRNNLKFEIDAFPGQNRLVEVANGQGSRYAVLSSLVVGKDTRSPLTIGLLADVTPIQEARLAQRAALHAAEVEVQTARLKDFEFKQMFECCLLLMGGHRGQEEHIDVVPFAQEWIGQAREVGLATVSEVSEEGPQVAGGSDDLRAVVRLAAAAACARCGVTPLEVHIDVRGINFETVGLEVMTRPAPDAEGAARLSTLDATMIQAALRAVCKRLGAQLGEIVMNDEACHVRMTLRGAAERLTTTRKTAKG